MTCRCAGCRAARSRCGNARSRQKSSMTCGSARPWDASRSARRRPPRGSRTGPAPCRACGGRASRPPPEAPGGFLRSAARCPGRAVDALEHRTLLVAPPVGAGDGEQLERLGIDLRGVRHVGPAAQVGEAVVRVRGDLFVRRKVVDQLELVGLVGKAPAGLARAKGPRARTAWPPRTISFIRASIAARSSSRSERGRSKS